MATPLRCPTLKTPTGARCLWLATLAVVATSVPLAAAESDGATNISALDRNAVLTLSAQAPEVAVAEARLGEARALRVGAGALASANPELLLFGGPRRLATGDRSTDLVLSLMWPIDVAGVPSARKEAAERNIAVADAEAADVRRMVAAESLLLWVEARGAEARVTLERTRAALDQELVRIARVRRQVGVVGDADVALADIVASDGRARLAQATSEAEATLWLLGGRLGLPSTYAIALAGTLEEAAPLPALAALIARLPRRADVIRAERAQPAAVADRTREARLGVPLPRLMLGIGRENETFARLGLDVPLPVYQRNQTNRAIAEARVTTTEVEQVMIVRAAEAELRASYARYVGARDAWQTRAAALPSVADVERLAMRGYELGSVPLSTVIVSRREAAGARTAHLEGLVGMARARVGVERAAGMLP